MPVIIRALWGCDQPESRWGKVITHDVMPVLKRMPTCQQYVYCYGKNNADLLTGRGYDVVLVDERPWPDGRADLVRNKTHVRPWHYKFELIRRAVKDHGEVVYCDWDVACLVKDVDAAFASFKGRDLSLSIYAYWRARHPMRGDSRAARMCVTGNWLHVKGIAFVDAVLARMRDGDEWWAWHDELTMGNLIDEMNGGWPGDIEWLRKYESPIMVQRRNRSPWPVTSDDGQYVTKATPIPFRWERLFTQWGKRHAIRP